MRARIVASLRDTTVMGSPLAAGIGVYELLTLFVPGWALAVAVFLLLWRAYYLEHGVGGDALPRFGADGEAGRGA